MKGTVMVVAAQASAQAATPAASQSTNSAGSQAAAPTVLPRTGGVNGLGLWILAGVGLLALGLIFRFAQHPSRP